MTLAVVSGWCGQNAIGNLLKWKVKIKVTPTVVETMLSKGLALKDNSEIRQQLVGKLGLRKMF